MYLLLEDNVFQTTWFSVIIAICIGLVSLGVILLASFFWYRHSIKKTIRDLDVRYNNIHDSVTSNCYTMIQRLEIISHNNSNFDAIYQSYRTRYNEIFSKQDKDCFVAIQSLKSLISTKKYKGIKSIIDSTKKTLDCYKRDSVDLSNDLQSILKKEDDLQSMMVTWKEKFRNLKQIYSDNVDSLESLSKSFEILFSHITNIFSQFEESLNMADYDKANELIPQAEKIIEATSKAICELPTINALAEQVIPQKLKDLVLEYNNMRSEGYILHHLSFEKKIERINNELNECREKLRKLNVKNVNESFDKIMLEISEFHLSFEQERQAKAEFDSLNNIVINSTYQAEKQNANLKKSLPNYQQAYVISASYLGQMEKLESMINEMTTKKRNLDAYMNSQTKQPYSILMTTIKELKALIDKIQESLDDFHTYLLSLKSDSEMIYKYIRTSYVESKKYEMIIKSVNIASFTNIYGPRITKLYQYIDKLDYILATRPIDIVNLLNVYKEANEFKTTTFDIIDKACSDMKKAEEFIVYDNRYRMLSPTCNMKMVNVEQAFNESDFSRAIMQAGSVYNEEQALRTKGK